MVIRDLTVRPVEASGLRLVELFSTPFASIFIAQDAGKLCRLIKSYDSKMDDRVKWSGCVGGVWNSL